MNYRDFLASKSQLGGESGFEPVWLPDFLFDFQRHLVEWAVRKGRAAIFADCGLGKTPMQLVWAENVHRKTGRPVVVITPLAVAAQTEREATKFGIDAKVSRDGTVHRITITNYERLHYFKQEDFVGAVADESSAIKAFDGRRRKQVVRFFSKLPYRLLCTATPSPNDFIELGTQSECLGIMTQSDMLGFFFRETENMRHTIFKNDDFWNKCKYWFKPHSEQPFWRWVCSWARALRSPADMGFDGSRFVLPPIEYHKHVTDVPFIPKGELFPRPSVYLHEQREERHRTLHERCEKVAELVKHDRPAIAWCHYNEEGDLLEKLIPRALQIKGAHPPEYKEAVAEWFSGNKCICNDPMFHAKIAAWEKDRRATGSGTTASTATNSSPGKRGCEKTRSSEKSGTSTAGGTTAPTNGCGSGAESSKTKSMPGGENGTPATPRSGRGRSKKSASTACGTQTPGSGVNSGGTDSPSKNTGSSLSKAARSAAEKLTSISEGSNDSISTTVTPRGSSEVSSAPHATSASENSGTTPSGLSARPCICGHADGNRKLVSKPSICGHGLNWQFCREMTFFPSFSFEQFYQGVRRCYRFGQRNTVHVHIVSALGEAEVIEGLARKQKQAETMFASLVRHMNSALEMTSVDGHEKKMALPPWLSPTKEEELCR